MSLLATIMCERLEAWLRDQTDVDSVEASKNDTTLIVRMNGMYGDEVVIDVYELES